MKPSTLIFLVLLACLALALVRVTWLVFMPWWVVFLPLVGYLVAILLACCWSVLNMRDH
jgi:hypothetical protein